MTPFFISVNYKAKDLKLRCEVTEISNQIIKVKVHGKFSELMLQCNYPIAKLGGKGVIWKLLSGNPGDAQLLTDIFHALESHFKYSERNKRQVIFGFNGKDKIGFLEPVAGAESEVWHLMVDSYYWGRLRKEKGKWVFDPTPKTEELKDQAEHFGEYAEFSKSQTGYKDVR